MSFSQHQIKTCWTDTLSAYLAQLRYEDIPPEVVQRVKQIILQVVGVSLAAAGEWRETYHYSAFTGSVT